jgi:hypothetical protein
MPKSAEESDEGVLAEMSEKWTGEVVAIQITSKAGEKMIPVKMVRAIAG